MIGMAMDTTPAGAHRVLAPLNWSRHPVDGDLMRALAADGSRGLRGHAGVSFFTPASAEAAEVAHKCLHKPVHGCAITVPDVAMPADLRFINDRSLKLPVFNPATGQTEQTDLGQHWTLFSSCNTSTKAFEGGYAQVLSSCIPCEPAAAAAPALDVDWDYMPTDRMTMASALALDEFASSSDDPNTRMFSTIYTLHMRAVDMAFADVLEFGPAAAMVAAALDAWTVTDPFLAEDVLQARELLSKKLAYEFSALQYKPNWDVHPFQFVGGKYDDALYDAEVRVCAQGFKGDEALKTKVQGAAAELFAKLAAAPEACQVDEASFMHMGLTFTVKCAKASSGSVT